MPVSPTTDSVDPESAPRVEAIDRAITLLTTLAQLGPEGAGLAELCERAGVNKSTAYRALATFRARGFAVQLANGNYALGPAATGLADRFLGGENLVAHLHPALVELSREAQELVHLGGWEGEDVVYLDKVEPKRAIRVWSAVGQRVPAATSALGRALLAARDIPEDRLGVYLRNLPPERAISQDQLSKVVRRARRLGYSTENEENEPGVACIGLALMRGDDAVGAISITSVSSRMGPDRRKELVALARRVLPPLLPEGISLSSAN